jgi:SAM-dependent methyltransferase
VSETIATDEPGTREQVARFWSRSARRGELGFWDVPGWKEHQNLLASGRPDRSWIDVLTDELRAAGVVPGLALSLGSGGGCYEPLLLERGLARSVEACDLSPDLVAASQARADAQGLPIRYFVADLNAPQLAPRRYDLILAAAVFHHVERLERLFESLARTLRPGGRLLVYDYVGPSRFQWRAEQIAVCNAWLGRLPARYRRKQGYPWHYVAAKRLFDALRFPDTDGFERWLGRCAPERVFAQYRRLRTARLSLDEIVRPAREQFLVTDPSEAIRSEETLGLLALHFDIRRTLVMGGTLVQPLFQRTAANFCRDTEGGAWVERILADERELVRSGRLASDLVALHAVVR